MGWPGTLTTRYQPFGDVMKIEMIGRVSGTRNGVKWPEPGGVIDVTAGEAETLISTGVAKEADNAAAPREPEASAVVEPEASADLEDVAPAQPVKRGPGRPRKGS